MSGPIFPSNIAIERVKSWSQFTSCLDLRLKVYRELGYLDEETTCDLDSFDWSSVHFIATDENDQIAGTVRLILCGGDDFPATQELLQSNQWSSDLQKLNQSSTKKSDSLPVLETLNDNRISDQGLKSRKRAELSRIIVASNYRSSGVCRRLCEAVVSESKRFRVDTLYLQCLPSHVGLFRKFGFDLALESLEYRFLQVPGSVAVMQMSISSESTRDGDFLS
jgi:predicted GNAT family N-acyltransferase